MFKVISSKKAVKFINLPYMLWKEDKYCLLDQKWSDFLSKLPTPPYTVPKLSNMFMSFNQKQIAEAIPLVFNKDGSGILDYNEYLKDDGVFNYILESSKKLIEFTDNRLPYLESGSNSEILLSREYVVYLMSHLLIGSYPDPPMNCAVFRYILNRRNFGYNKAVIPQKIAGLFQYFKCMKEKELHNPEGKYIRIMRNILPSPIDWSNINKKLCEFVVKPDGSLTDNSDTIHSIFANDLIGGGVLGYGLIQEELIEMRSPESLMAVLLCEKMSDNEAVFVQGCESFNEYTGYKDNARLTGMIKDKTDVKDGIIQNDIVIFDALHFTNSGTVKTNKSQYQFSKKCIDRELNKAYTAFLIDEKKTNKNVLSTGNWGCGVYHGNHELKCLIQWMACTAANGNRIKMEYYPFHDARIEPALNEFLKFDLSNVTVNQLYKWILEYGELKCKNHSMREKLFKFIEKKLI